MAEYRLQRVENLLREEISSMIMRGVIKDPRISTLTSITRIEVSNDLSHAKVFISGFENENKIKKCVDALNHASGYIQKQLGKKMHTRSTPKPHFIFDTSIKDGFEMTRKLEDLEITPESDTENTE